jgi:YD repeat-containing protein
MNVGSSGGQITSTMPGSAGAKSNKKDDGADPPKKRPSVKKKVLSLAPPPSQTTTQTATKKTVADAGRRAVAQAPALNTAATDPGPQIKQSTGTTVDIAPSTITAPGLQKQVVARMTAVTKPLAQSPVSGLSSFVALAPTANGKQPVSVDSPTLLGFMAAGRQLDRKSSTEDETLARTVDSTQTGLMTTTTTSSLSLFQTTSLWSLFSRDTTKPTVNLSAPGGGGPVSGTVTLSATASDNVGVTDVKFYVDNSTTPLATDTTSPYNTSWNTTTVTNGAHTIKAVARDAAGNTTTSTRTITVDNAKPAVSLSAPGGGGPVSGTVTLSATASDNVGVTDVKFYVDNSTTPLATDTTSPYNTSWNTTTVTNGAHTLSAVARDAAGNTTTSTVNITVANPDVTAPSAAVTAPTGPVSGVVNLSANAADNVGVTGVQFFVNGTAVGAEDSTSPYSAAWNTTTVANGTYTVTARARDAAGNTTLSAPVTVTVANPDVTAPSVSLTGLANGATVSGSVPLSASASDNIGVTQVQFFVDNSTTALATDTTSPYTASWDTTTATNGAHTLRAVARDAAGNTTTSTVNVTVANAASQLPVTVTAIPVNTYPTAIAISGDNAYIYGGDVIWTVDTRTNTVIDATAIYNDPPAVTSDGRTYAPNPNLYYQGNAPYDSVDVIDSATGTVIKNIPLPACYDCYSPPSGPRDLVLSPDGRWLYVSEDYWTESGPALTEVTVIDTATDTVVGVHYTVAPTIDMEITPDGRIYAADQDYWYSDVLIYDANWNYTGSIRLSSLVGSSFSWPTALALSADGKRAFVHVYDFDGRGKTVSVLDIDPQSPTYNTEIAVITERYSVVSPDGTRRYVAEQDGRTITVYDNVTNAKIGSFVTDNEATVGPRGLAVAPNGTLYVADPGDNKVYAVAVGGTTSI